MQTKRFIFTFHAALTPETWMCQNLFVLLARLVVARAVRATHSGRVQPIVRPYCDGHQAESCKSPSCSDEHLCSAVARPHRSSISWISRTFQIPIPPEWKSHHRSFDKVRWKVWWVSSGTARQHGLILRHRWKVESGSGHRLTMKFWEHPAGRFGFCARPGCTVPEVLASVLGGHAHFVSKTSAPLRTDQYHEWNKALCGG